MRHYLHIIWEAPGTLAAAAQRAEGAGGLRLKGDLEKTLGADGRGGGGVVRGGTPSSEFKAP